MRGPRHSDQLSGKVALIFGGGSPTDAVNVGQAAAIGYAAAGAAIAVADVQRENAERTGRLCNGALMLEADITDDRAIVEAIDATIERFGKIDILHNNVGFPSAGPFNSFDRQRWMRGFEINCVGAVQTIRHALPHLFKTHGAIVNVSSVAAIRYTGIDYAIYNSSKAALDQVTVAVALEYAGRGVRANAILPGLLDTEMGRALADPANVAERARRSPTGWQGDVWDVANAAVFLASDEARYINGHLLVVDGGLSQRC